MRYWQRRSNNRSSDIFALVAKKTRLELTEAYCWLLLFPWLLSPWLLEPARAKDATAGNVKMIGAMKVPFLKTSLLVVRSESNICHLLHCQLKAPSEGLLSNSTFQL